MPIVRLCRTYTILSEAAIHKEETPNTSRITNGQTFRNVENR